LACRSHERFSRKVFFFTGAFADEDQTALHRSAGKDCLCPFLMQIALGASLHKRFELHQILRDRQALSNGDLCSRGLGRRWRGQGRRSRRFG
jgi:hypothetical protein